MKNILNRKIRMLNFEFKKITRANLHSGSPFRSSSGVGIILLFLSGLHCLCLFSRFKIWFFIQIIFQIFTSISVLMVGVLLAGVKLVSAWCFSCFIFLSDVSFVWSLKPSFNTTLNDVIKRKFFGILWSNPDINFLKYSLKTDTTLLFYLHPLHFQTTHSLLMGN